jgi:hypothetical protein
MARFGTTLRDATALYHASVAIPANTSANGTGIATGKNGQSGKIAVRAEITEAGVLTDTKVLTLALQDSADNSTFATLDTFTKTASGATTLVLGALVHEFILPRKVREYTRVVVTTNDALVTGKIEVFGNMVP